MKDESSVFGAKPDNLDRLLQFGLEPPQAEEGEPAPKTPQDALAEKPGSRIGHYKLLKILGEGGMGIIYLAQQEEPVRRRVALKIIKPGMDSKRVLARFEAERQALALLDHPNIAQVYDAGTADSGRPYFVMEYVKGTPITEFCDRHTLSIEDRLRLFQQVCQAVQHAHQKGIIHRDIKPSNILVTGENDQAIPKIIDFGVAKALLQPLTDRTVYTEQGQLFGTPEYMSPEQADMVNEDIDTRSDVYSLGVLLYVLLTGVLPFDPQTLRDSGIENIRRTIRETDPKTPSTRLTELGEEAAKIAERCCMQISTLARHLRKELEWIPLKAMRKERSERYRSASELSDDIENYLKGAPLIAGPLGTSYKVKKFVRRNRVLVGGIAVVIGVLIAGVLVSTIFAMGQVRARAEADFALAEAQLITDFLENDVLGSAGQANVDEATVSYTLDAASTSLGKFTDKPLIEARICLTLGKTYTYLGEYEKGEQHIRRSTEIYRQHFGEAHPDTLRAMGSIAWVCFKQSRYRETVQIYTRILQIGQGVLSVERQVDVMNMLGAAYLGLGEDKQAELLYDEILQIVQSELGGQHSLLSYIKHNHAVSYLKQGRYDEAARVFEKMLTGTELPNASGVKKSLGVTYWEQGRYDEAERLLDEALEAIRLQLGDKHPIIPEFTLCLAQLHIEQERYEEAEDLLREGLAIARQKLGPEKQLTLSFVNAYAVLHTKQGHYDQAEKLFDEALKSRQRELGDDHPNTLKTLNDFGVLRREQGQYEEAARLLNEALEGRKIKLGPDHPYTLGSMHELAMLYKEQAQYEKAEPLFVQALEGRRLKLGDRHPHTRESLNNLIALYEAWGKPEQANEW
ncbi:tetratricopeptide repeat protein [Planctomycetota bacterium]